MNEVGEDPVECAICKAVLPESHVFRVSEVHAEATICVPCAKRVFVMFKEWTR